MLLTTAFLGSSHAQPPGTTPYVSTRPVTERTFELQTLAQGLPLPVELVAYDDTSYLLVALDGNIYRVAADDYTFVPFLSLGGRVTGLYGEQGLFSVALQPVATAEARGGARHIFASFTESGSNDLVVAAYKISQDDSRADRASERIVLWVPVEEPFHHGGQVAFGPDGMLYIGVGDGQREMAYLHVVPHVAQDLASLRGKILRIDPLPTGSDSSYTVPSDNPFVGHADSNVRPEIWALGLRNPWKFTFAASDGALITSDVGQDLWEEINVIEAGNNYGWPIREGHVCSYFPDVGGMIAKDCPEQQLTDPTAAYGHLALEPDGGQSVTGGFEVAAGGPASLRAQYLFADYVTGRIWALNRATGLVTLLHEARRPITSIIPGLTGEVLVLSIDGTLAKLVDVSVSD